MPPGRTAPANPTRALTVAVAKGEAAAIPGLVAKGADPNTRFDPTTGESGAADPDPDLTSLLTVSVYCGCIEVTRALLAAGARPDALDVSYAANFSQFDIALAMLDAPTFPAAQKDYPFAYMLAWRMTAEMSDFARRRLLDAILTGKADEDANGTDEAPFTPAYVRDPGDPIFAFLDGMIRRGFDINVAGDGLNARAMASTVGDVLLARGLASRGATLDPSWNEVQEKEIQLVGAAATGNLSGAALLLGEGISANAADVNGRYALATALDNRNLEIGKKLLDAGADPRRFGAKQASPLVSASKLDQPELVVRLIEKGAVPDQLDGTGKFALQAAVREGANRALAALLARGASPRLTDARRRTALHGLIEPDVVPSFSSPRNRALNATHIESVRVLAAAGVPLSAKDADDISVLSSNFGYERADLELVHALLATGAKPLVDDLYRALRIGDPALLRTLLRHGVSGPLPVSLLNVAFSRLNDEADLAAALLEYGVELPKGDYQRKGLLVEAAGAAGTTVLGLLLSRGLPLSADPEGDALETALKNGRPKNIAVLAARGANLHAKDSAGRTPLHRYVRADTTRTGDSRIGAQQKAAISALVDAGFVLSTPDKDGKAASALAQGKPGTLAALNQAIAAAGADATGIHGAIRSGNLDEVRRLAADAAAREQRDSLGRTPLSLALQSANWPAARILLRSGAVITLASPSSWQPADTAFAGERSVAGAFAVRLLSATLVDIPADRTTAGVAAIRQGYRDGRSLPFADFTWRVRCEATGIKCGDGVLVAGNKGFFYDLIESSRFDRDAKTSYSLVQRNMRSIHLSTDINLGSLGGPAHLDFGEVTWLLRGSVAIQACVFGFENPLCSPGVRIHNPNEEIGLSMRTDTGFEKLPTANLRYVQPNGTSGMLAPGETVVLDRSAGPITLEMDEVSARVFALSVEVERVAGEEVGPLPADASTESRMAFYARLASLHARKHPAPASTVERVSDKNLASTIAALSAEAYLANYPTVVLALLRQQAGVIANLDRQVRAIQNAVLAQATYTPAQIDVLVTQIDAVLAAVAPGDQALLSAIRAELVRLRASAAATGVAVNELRDTLFSDTDLLIELYQALVLEYRQFVPSDALDTALNSNLRSAVAERIGGREVLIGDAAVDGTGSALRASFGLPDPEP